jgi:deoxyribose-phosphate aldolase
LNPFVAYDIFLSLTKGFKMLYFSDNKNIYNCTDFTYLDDPKSNEQSLYDYYNQYLKLIKADCNPASFCVSTTHLTLLSKKYEIIKPCVVINFPHATDTYKQIEIDFKIAEKFNAEVDIVFPTKEHISNNDSKVLELLEFYNKMILKYNIKIVKIILETSYYTKHIKNISKTEKDHKTNKFFSACELSFNYLKTKNNNILFFKTSTGKVFKKECHTSALSLISSFITNKGEHYKDKLGIKISGGIRDKNDVFKNIQHLTTLDKFTDNNLFRFGASQLLINL